MNNNLVSEMPKVKIENNIIIVSEINHPTHIFKVCEKLPKGYCIWNIGKHMGTDEYIPCGERISAEKPYSINPNTLIAIKLPIEEVLILRKVAGNCGGTLAEMKRALKRKKLYIKRELVEQAIMILERLQENNGTE